MKTCPNCGVQYENDMSFCLEDGKSLVASEEIPDTEKETLDLPKDSIPDTEKETLDLPKETVPNAVSDLSLETKIRTIAENPRLTDENAIADTQKQIVSKDEKSSSSFLTGALALISLLLLGTTIGIGYLYIQTQGDSEIASANPNNSESDNSNKNSKISGGGENLGLDADNTNSNLSGKEDSANPSPTKSPKETPKPTTTQVPTPTKSPKEKPTRTPTPTPKPTQTKGETRGIKILSKPTPRYTEAARQNNTQGIVRLKVTFLASGRIGNISVIQGLPHGLSQSAARAAKAIRFKPAMKNGTPVSVTKTIQYNFVIY